MHSVCDSVKAMPCCLAVSRKTLIGTQSSGVLPVFDLHHRLLYSLSLSLGREAAKYQSENC